MKAKKFAVFDFIKRDCAVTSEAVREYYDRQSITAEVKEFTEMQPLIYDFRDNKYDITFIGLSSMLDVETARSIRRLDKKCPIILVSDVADFAIEGYRLNVVDYLVKPVTYELICDAVSCYN